MGKRIEGARPTVGLSTWRAHCLQGELGGRGEGRKQEKRYERAKTKSQGREVAHTPSRQSKDERDKNKRRETNGHVKMLGGVARPNESAGKEDRRAEWLQQGLVAVGGSGLDGSTEEYGCADGCCWKDGRGREWLEKS